MTSKLNPRWLTAALIWLAASMVSYLNYAQIQEIATIRENNDRLRKEMLFQYRNAAQLDQIQNIQASCSLPVASVKLGFESVRSRLLGLSANLGFSGVTIDSQMEQATESRVPFRLRMQGTFEKTGKWIAALQSIPYLSIKSSRMVVAWPKPDAEIELALDFQFKIDPAQVLEIRSLQAAAEPREQKAVTR
jgi:Tfp pilus assembly protein PilO